ncbi:GlxA family transcriptional regulator [Rheinheimera marina]|uniref:GlxA family transcriptional regulator n=1 Tax=Rheinheimera marina TaxID=1774958 RepID=A0ABV9JQ76_9GAMM
MKTIAVWVSDQVALGAVASIQDFFTFCNQYWYFLKRQEPLFQVRLMGPSPLVRSGAVLVEVEPVDLNAVDALIIPGFHDTKPADLLQASQVLSPYQSQITDFYQRDKWLTAFCSGAFALAGIGLLDHKQATSVWFFKDYFRQMFPKVQLNLQQLVVQQQNILTAGATTSYLNLCLRLLELMMDTAFAQQMAKIMLTDPNRNSQLPYLSLQLPLVHADPKLAEIQHYMQQHLRSPLSLDSIAETFAMTSRTLIRRFKQHLDETPMAYLQRLRIERAKALLENTTMAVEQVMTEVGYEDLSSFRKLFIHYTSLTPKAYRHKFMVEPALLCCSGDD